MKNKYLIILVFFSVILNFLETIAEENKILFKVNNEIITSFDLLEEAKYLKVLNKELENADKKIVYEIAKKSLIRYKIREIELYNNIEDYQIDQEILKNLLLSQFKKINIKSETELNNLFSNKNINHNYVLNRIKIDVLWNEYIYSKFSKKVKIDKNEIKKELENKKIEKKYLLREILFDLDTNEDFNTKLNLIEKTIKNKGFSEAALTYSISTSSSNGGKLDWINETSLNQKIRKKLNQTDIGKYTQPIVIPGGFLILQIENQKNVEIEIDLEKTLKQISQKKMNEQLNQFSNIYYNKIKKDFIINDL
jgi:peptidyl-prolyl cis-trans isomerase SurA